MTENGQDIYDVMLAIVNVAQTVLLAYLSAKAHRQSGG